MIHAILDTLYGRILTPERRARPEKPDLPGAGTIACHSRDGCPLRGWFVPPRGVGRGTIFWLHGFGAHCMIHFPEWAGVLTHAGLASVALDFRFHGHSGNAIPTFGTAEMGDVQAALDWADAHGFPQPHLLAGDSLGAMAATRTAIADHRVRACLLKNPPATPRHAIQATLRSRWRSRLAAWAINAAYGWPILDDGDPCRHPGTLPHQPLLFYLMGSEDHFDIAKTRRVYDHFHSPRHGFALTIRPETDLTRYAPLLASGQDPRIRKWFVTIRGGSHPDQRGRHFGDFNYPWPRPLRLARPPRPHPPAPASAGPEVAAPAPSPVPPPSPWRPPARLSQSESAAPRRRWRRSRPAAPSPPAPPRRWRCAGGRGQSRQ
jgi:hypothetical protein